jgi:5-methylcytosine-specific restriction endonuclease McrA
MRKKRPKAFELIGTIVRNDATSQWGSQLILGRLFKWVPAGDDDFHQLQKTVPQEFHEFQGSRYWAFREKVIKYTPDEATVSVSPEEFTLLLKHFVLKGEANMARVRREVQAFENLQTVSKAQRERIPEEVRLFVWQRDEGRCVRCGSNLRLEFDHIIPVVENGSNTERNIQLLCETCNRQKGRTV